MSDRESVDLGGVSRRTFMGAVAAAAAGAWSPCVRWAHVEEDRPDPAAVSMETYRSPLSGWEDPWAGPLVFGPTTVIIRDGGRGAWREGSGEWWGDDRLVEEIGSSPPVAGEEDLAGPVLDGYRWAAARGLIDP